MKVKCGCLQTVICFLEADFTQLKQALLEHCHRRQTSLTVYLHESASKEQNDIFEFIECRRLS